MLYQLWAWPVLFIYIWSDLQGFVPSTVPPLPGERDCLSKEQGVVRATGSMIYFVLPLGKPNNWFGSILDHPNNERGPIFIIFCTIKISRRNLVTAHSCRTSWWLNCIINGWPISHFRLIQSCNEVLLHPLYAKHVNRLQASAVKCQSMGLQINLLKYWSDC